MGKFGLTILVTGVLIAGTVVVVVFQRGQSTRQEYSVANGPNSSEESLQRKARSMAALRKEAVPVIEHLPVIVDSRLATIRTKDTIAQRAIAICLTAVKGEGLDQATVDGLVKKYGAESLFSPKEAAFIHNPAPSQQDRIQFAWRYEDFWVLLWALGYVDNLDRPDSICDVKKAIVFLRDRTTAEFIRDAKLRDINEILDQADLIFRYDWAAVNARLKGQKAPAGLDGEVVQERHYVLNWLVGYMNQKWDDISTDT
jgi:hypothetical protein